MQDGTVTNNTIDEGFASPQKQILKGRQFFIPDCIAAFYYFFLKKMNSCLMQHILPVDVSVGMWDDAPTSPSKAQLY